MNKAEQIFIFLIAAFTGLTVYEGFVESTITIKWIAFQLILSVGTILYIGRTYKQKKNYKLDCLYIYVIFLLCYLIIRVFISSSADFSSVYHYFCFGLLYTFFKFRRYSDENLTMNKILLFIAVILSIWGICQFLQKEMFIVGSFDNPAGLAITLSCIFPFVCELIERTPFRQMKILYCMGALIILLSVFLSQSRTGLIACMAVLLFFLVRHKIITLTLLILFSVTVSIFYKTDSTKGRMFIYETSLSMLKPTTLLCGNGAGSFKRDYMRFQAEFFLKNKNNPSGMLANNVSHPLNEFILVLIEFGLLGFLMLIIPICILFACKEKRASTTGCLLAIGICSLFSYPFRYPMVLFLLAYSLASFNFGKQYDLKKYMYGIHYFVILISISCIIYVSNNAINQYQWKRQIKNSSFGYFEKAYPIYKKIHKKMPQNPYFLFNYSSVLYTNNLYEESLNIASECTKYLNDYDVELLFAENYLSLKNYQKAEIHFRKASAMCPVRFVPLFRLYQIYIEQKDTVQASQIGKQILQKEVKIDSPTIHYIKKTIKEDLLQK